MPPSTRSQTARSRPPNDTPTTAVVEENFRNLELSDSEDDESQRRVPQPPSPDYDPEEDRREALATGIHSTPKYRRIAPSVTSRQRDLVRAADPNRGHCFITNRRSPVESCHIVARATEQETLAKLEYVWGYQDKQFNVNTRYNMFYLQCNWHRLFDDSQWLLVPEDKVLRKLTDIYVTKKCATSNLTELFEGSSYQYYVLPVPTLEEPICRFSDITSTEHETLFPPFAGLGPLTSHIYPHFVVFNTGRKLAALGEYDIEMAAALGQTIPPSSNGSEMLTAIRGLYGKWIKVQIPCRTIRLSNKPSPSPEKGRDDRSGGGPPPKRSGLRSAGRSQGQGSQAAGDEDAGGQQRAILPFQLPENDDSSSVDDTIFEDDADWIEYIHDWQKQDVGIMESDVLDDSRDEQLAAYIGERARTPPTPGAWERWKPAWDDRKSQYPDASDRSQFSSNDWAVVKSDVYLTRSEHPRVALYDSYAL